jgi:hypothetical protein
MDVQEDVNIPTCDLTKIVHHAKSMQFSKSLLIFMIQQLVTSFEHFFNKHGIEIISWGEVKDMVLTIMNYIYDQQSIR